MRIADRVTLIEKATDSGGQITLQSQPRLDGTEYEVQNWAEVHAALDEIIRRGWFTGQTRAEMQHETYVRDMVETRPPTQQLVLVAQQHNELQEHIRNFCQTLPQALHVLKAESAQDESLTAVFTVEIGEFGSLDEASERIREVFNIFGRSLNVAHQPNFVGMDSGSNYLIFDVDHEITKWAISSAIQIAEAIWEQLQGLASIQNISLFMNWIKQAMGNRLAEEENDIDLVRQASIASSLQQAVDALRADVQDKFKEQQDIGNEAANHINMAVPQIIQLLDKGATFQRPENDETTVTNIININIHVGTVNILPLGDTRRHLLEGEVETTE